MTSANQHTGNSVSENVALNIPTGRAMWVVMIIMFASNILASFDQSLMNIGLDQVVTDFNVRLSVANWMVLGFTIVAATTITMAASLLKRFGVRKIMLAGYMASLVGSLLGYFSWDFWSMFAGRLIQALTVGLFFPVITSVILTISPKGKAAIMLAINSGVIGLGLAAAPLGAGLLITSAGLRSVFLIPAVMSLVLMLVSYFCIHDIYQRESRTIDVISVGFSFVGLGLFIFGLNEVSHSVVPSVLCMVAGLAFVALFTWRQAHISTPLLDLAPLKNPRFTIGEALLMLGYMGSIYMSLLVPLYLEGTAHYSAFLAGALLTGPILSYALFCFVGGKIKDKHGIWPLVPAGFLVVLIGYSGLCVTSSYTAVIAMMACAALSYGGIGLLFPALKATNLEVLPASMYAHGSAIHSTLVQIAGSFGSALFVGIMSEDVANLMATGASKAAAYAAGFEHTLWIAMVLIAFAFVASIFFARAMHKSHQI